MLSVQDYRLCKLQGSIRRRSLQICEKCNFHQNLRYKVLSSQPRYVFVDQIESCIFHSFYNNHPMPSWDHVDWSRHEVPCGLEVTLRYRVPGHIKRSQISSKRIGEYSSLLSAPQVPGVCMKYFICTQSWCDNIIDRDQHVYSKITEQGTFHIAEEQPFFIRHWLGVCQ